MATDTSKSLIGRGRFIARMVKFRQEAGLTAQQVAKIAGISRSGVNKMESAIANPTLESLGRYVAACKRDLSELFCNGNGRRRAS